MGRYFLCHRTDCCGFWLFRNRCGRSERRESIVLYLSHLILGFAGWRVAAANRLKQVIVRLTNSGRALACDQ